MPEITLSQGTIHYRDAGEGPPVVFLHGLLVDGEVWRKVTPLLQGDGALHRPRPPARLASRRDERRRRPLARGCRAAGRRLHGRRSTSRTSPSSATTPAAPSASSSRSTTASASGGSCSPTATASRSSRPRSSCRWSRPRACRARSTPRCSRCARPRRGGRRWPMAGSRTRSPTRSPTPGSQPFLDDADIRRDAIAFMRAIDKATTLDAAARLPSLEIPSLVVWGQDDRFFARELGERLAAALGARLAPVAGARTFVSEDEPEASRASSATSCARAPHSRRPEPRRALRRSGRGEPLRREHARRRLARPTPRTAPSRAPRPGARRRTGARRRS